MRDYWLSKMLFDLQDPSAATEYRADRKAVMDRYPMTSEVRAAVEADDVAYLSHLVNPYLLRFYFFIAGMSDAEFVKRIRVAHVDPKGGAAHG